MSSTSYAIWRPPLALQKMLREMGDAVVDLAPAMERVSRLGFEEITQRLNRGGGDIDWAPLAETTIERHGPHPLSIGKGGGFVPTLRRDFTKSNAVVFTKAPHAHFFDEGRSYHYVGGKHTHVYTTRGARVRGKSKGMTGGGKHVSKAASKKLLLASTSDKIQPARNFMFFSDNVKNRAGDIILAHVFDAVERVAA